MNVPMLPRLPTGSWLDVLKVGGVKDVLVRVNYL